MRLCLIVLLWFVQTNAFASPIYNGVELGVDQFFSLDQSEWLQGKRVGLITNATGLNKKLIPTVDLFMKNMDGFTVTALFSPEHGLFGEIAAGKEVKNLRYQGVPVYSLHGKTRRPTAEMLKNIDVLFYDIQDIGSRSYTYATTLYYAMEEAAKYHIPVVVLDRPNPMGGEIVDGPMLEDKYRSFIGYINVPYCHGMTIGELARFFNEEYGIHCDLKVVPMKGWKRKMAFADTGLSWVPTSPYIPEKDTPFFYASTGWMGELGLVQIGIGYTLPFKVVGAPWIKAQELAEKLTQQQLPGARFIPWYFTPQYGRYKGEVCQGILIIVENRRIYHPIRVQCFILGLIKSLYPKIVEKRLLAASKESRDMFCKAVGNAAIFSFLVEEKYPAWRMSSYQSEQRAEFIRQRKKYLLYN